MCDTLDILPKELSSFKVMGELLKCGICYEYLTTALITPCSHNYCSYCIRKSLLYKTQCPACFEETTEFQLRNNRILDELIVIFTDLSDKLVKYLVNRSSENKDLVLLNATDVTSEQDSQSFDRRAVPSTSFAQERTPVKNSEVCVTPKKKLNIPTLFSPKKQQKQQLTSVSTVSCPVCSVDVPEKNINLHLDACLKRAEGTVESRRVEVQKLKPMPKLVYTLLNDKSLKKKLSEHGLSTAGDRATLINRHRRFTVLYNSECDSLNPRPVSKLVQQIEKEEREEKKLASESPQKLAAMIKVLPQHLPGAENHLQGCGPWGSNPLSPEYWILAALKLLQLSSSRLNVDRKADAKVIEAAHQQYLQQHKASFDTLIQSVKERGAKTKLLERVAKEEKEDDPDVISVKSDSNDCHDFAELAEKSRDGLERSMEPGSSTDDCEITFINTVSNDDSEDDKLHEQNSLSPVLNTRGKLRREVHNISSTPDMFEGAADSDNSDDSNASISLMVYHTQESSLPGMPPSTYTPAYNGLSLSSEKENSNITPGEITIREGRKEGIPSNDSSLNGMPPSTYTADSEVQNDSPTTSHGETNRHSDFQPVNFDFDIDSLLMPGETEAVLPTRRQSKRRGSVVSTSSDEITTRRVLRKRVKR
ncbi:E3 ubiquitin-protein ligase RAD18 [Anabrus simplex]|uniref:E3 ubiquitin-protein ligase RAD18 n=1 Tax=Anabrus simplex TaxID=316456 RepID=UPI0035A3AB2F